MTFIAVAILCQAAEELDAYLESAERAVADGARLVEWRVDAIVGHAEAHGVIERLVRESPAPCIVTCRPEWEGGFYDGDDADRRALLEYLAEIGVAPRYVDLEVAAYRRGGFPPVVTTLPETGVILSSHDFDGRPADLLQRVESMTAEVDGSINKVAWPARSIRDNLEAFDLLSERRKPMVALCMGEYGAASRILAPKFGGFLTFAATVDGEGTAPGQLTVSALRNVYRFDDIGPATRVYGIIGWPVAHSQGPRIHNAGFTAAGHDGVYVPLPVPPEWEHFKASVGALVDHPRLDFRGASVTIPHKEHLVRFVRERGGVVEPSAAAIGAANTLIVSDDGALACANTDAPAAVTCLRAPVDASVAVLGAGGVARAVTAGLAELGMRVTVFGRTAARAEALVADLAREFGDGISAGAWEDRGQGFDVYVNGTPIGMTGGPDPEGSPLPDDVALSERSIVFDTVYTPVRTPLIRDAEARGARVVTGVEMFVVQAALQFERWTGTPAPMEAFRDALRA